MHRFDAEEALKHNFITKIVSEKLRNRKSGDILKIKRFKAQKLANQNHQIFVKHEFKLES